MAEEVRVDTDRLATVPEALRQANALVQDFQSAVRRLAAGTTAMFGAEGTMRAAQDKYDEACASLAEVAENLEAVVNESARRINDVQRNYVRTDAQSVALADDAARGIADATPGVDGPNRGAVNPGRVTR
ncbi:hypothetical protein CFN78_16430 [Amycolatopsis antarctica]|uniref:Uncharacterized protein n=1 Tax=Amycolatopsis antarctica TaxID=1854586 RepID=A0A263D438_9PSEU|nr:hypothetical protein [Amycolatopsis antarctica]OZM72125.1 hypothetical protein CFN78_16430 [Amycolatopsis antarctica]